MNQAIICFIMGHSGVKFVNLHTALRSDLHKVSNDMRLTSFMIQCDCLLSV